MKNATTHATGNVTEVAVADRFRGAVRGQLIGDAASLGTHWIYNLDDLARKFPDGVEGFETPGEGHYHFRKKSGDLTHYGEAALLMLESVADKGQFEETDFGKRFIGHFGSPHYAGFLDKATRGTLENKRTFDLAHPGQPFPFQDGADDDQLATASRLAPVVAAHFGKDNLQERVERATRVCQDNDRAVAYMQAHALILTGLFEGKDLPAAAEHAVNQRDRFGAHAAELSGKIRVALDASEKDVTEATLEFGQACPLEQSFPAALQAALHHADDFREAILRVVRAGGDNAGRAALVGAWLGAAHGESAIPGDWSGHLAARQRIETALNRLIERIDTV